MIRNDRSEIVRDKDLTLLEKFYVLQILKGFVVTIGEMFQPKVTIQYPEERTVFTPSFRGRPVLVLENDTERCVACGLCSRVCPSLAIDVQAGETALGKERYPERFEIDMLRCIFCGFCEEVCPEEAIVMSNEYELAFENPKDAIYAKDKLLTPIEKLQPRLEFLRAHR